MLLRSTYIKSLIELAVVVCALAAPLPATAQTVIERLVEPGPLSEAHAEYEESCNVCHLSFHKEDQTALCLDCHEEIAADVDKGTGFHGISPDVAGATCKSCHTEHEGLEFDIVKFDATTFDHALTDYPLMGAHKTTECAECHKPDKKYREAPSGCYACHKEEEPHKGNLGTDCKSCHNESDWKKVDFDHSTTDFPLIGKHKEATCKACHIDEVYEDLPSKCIDCHEEDDTHEGSFGADCESCHTPENWTQISFDHGRKTGFSLTGGHADIECAACHTKTLFEPKLKTDCVSCHRKDDSHKGRNGPDCADCHVTTSWTATKFDHDTGTKFPLRGAHASVDCESCHLEPVTKSLPGTECNDCHREDDPHEGSQGENCAECHNEISWTQDTRFDHDLSRFPLLGEHASVECESCHTTKRFSDAPLECVACHEEDDKHEGALGDDCGACHNPNAWNLWIFNHDTQTEFTLTGAHENLACAACHRPGRRKASDQSSECIACHRADDKHRGEYGGDCGRCHTTDSFSTVKFP